MNIKITTLNLSTIIRILHFVLVKIKNHRFSSLLKSVNKKTLIGHKINAGFINFRFDLQSTVIQVEFKCNESVKYNILFKLFPQLKTKGFENSNRWFVKMYKKDNLTKYKRIRNIFK